MHHVLMEAGGGGEEEERKQQLQPSGSRPTYHVGTGNWDVTRAPAHRQVDSDVTNCSTGSTGCIPPALHGEALTIIAMAQAVCLYSPGAAKQESL